MKELNAAPTGNAKLVAWVKEWATLCEPDALYWCDGSKAEYDRLRAIVEESTRTTEEYRRQLEMNMSLYSSKQRAIMTEFLVSFEYNIETGENYDQALYSILHFADQTGIALQHRTLEEFSVAMNSDEDFVLKKR